LNLLEFQGGLGKTPVMKTSTALFVLSLVFATQYVSAEDRINKTFQFGKYSIDVKDWEQNPGVYARFDIGKLYLQIFSETPVERRVRVEYFYQNWSFDHDGKLGTLVPIRPDKDKDDFAPPESLYVDREEMRSFVLGHLLRVAADYRSQMLPYGNPRFKPSDEDRALRKIQLTRSDKILEAYLEIEKAP
jgi:hypothetical protein